MSRMIVHQIQIAGSPVAVMVAAAVVLVLAGTSGCASNGTGHGFLTTYKNLEPSPPAHMRYVAAGNRLGGYTKFMVDPVAVRLYEWEAIEEGDSEDVQHLRQYMYEAVRKAIAGRYPIVANPGPGVGRLRIAVTNIKKSSPGLAAVPEEKLTAIQFGKASLELELVDSITGDQVAALIDSGLGNRFSFTGLSQWGDVEAAMDQWAARLRQRIDEAHAQGGA